MSFLRRSSTIAGLVCLITATATCQDITINLGFRDSIASAILHEKRTIMVHLPDGYQTSGTSYPVLYRLDADTELLVETVSVLNRLNKFEEVAPEMIVVLIENTDRPRDMLPVRVDYYPGDPGADAFLRFIGDELIPYVDKKYRTSHERILCGKSLSGLFATYAFLARPELFDSYIICSAGFYHCEDYFKQLSQQELQRNRYNGQKVFITNGLNDPMDPDGSLHRQVVGFSELVKARLGDRIRYLYVTYENEGHVPFFSLYQGLKYLYEPKPKK